jgi:hypothetical protein
LVGRAGDRRCGDVGPKHAVDHAIDMVRPRTRSQPDGEADVGVRQDSGLRPRALRRIPLARGGREEAHGRESSSHGPNTGDPKYRRSFASPTDFAY